MHKFSLRAVKSWDRQGNHCVQPFLTSLLHVFHTYKHLLYIHALKHLINCKLRSRESPYVICDVMTWNERWKLSERDRRALTANGCWVIIELSAHKHSVCRRSRSFLRAALLCIYCANLNWWILRPGQYRNKTFEFCCVCNIPKNFSVKTSGANGI